MVILKYGRGDEVFVNEYESLETALHIAHLFLTLHEFQFADWCLITNK